MKAIKNLMWYIYYTLALVSFISFWLWVFDGKTKFVITFFISFALFLYSHLTIGPYKTT